MVHWPFDLMFSLHRPENSPSHRQCTPEPWQPNCAVCACRSHSVPAQSSRFMIHALIVTPLSKSSGSQCDSSVSSHVQPYTFQVCELPMVVFAPNLNLKLRSGPPYSAFIARRTDHLFRFFFFCATAIFDPVIC
jgi:hypothetical protein